MTSRAERKRTHKAQTIAKAKEPKTEGQVIPMRGKPEINQLDRDGLLWLRKKRRISARRFDACTEYRIHYREPEEGAMKSCLDDSPHGSGTGGNPADGYNAGKIDAKRKLFELRFVALRGHPEMIAVMDGIAGGGLTTREMAGGDKHRAAELETVLGVAADLIANHLWPTQERAAG